MGARSFLSGLVLAGLAVMLIQPGTALGSAIPQTVSIIHVTATSGGHTSTFDQVFPVSDQGGFNGHYGWALQAPRTLGDASIETLKVDFDSDPQVDLEFAITNDSLTNDIYFEISTARIAFAGIPNPEAAALASVTLTQGAGSAPGATITGGFPGGALYQARYSTDGIMNTADVFAALVSSFSTDLSDARTDMSPLSGMSVIPATVYMMETEFKFTLSAGDQASGTSTFLITPEPASLALMGLAGLLLIRGRRH